jgi:hypothetical protein
MTTAHARSNATFASTVTTGIKRQVVDRTAQVIYATFPQMSVAQQASRKYFAIFVTTVSAAGLLALLGINTLLAQDAFTLSNLKLEAKSVADQRDAVNREIDAHSAPNALAAAATALGMKPSERPIFLNIAPDEVKNG